MLSNELINQTKLLISEKSAKLKVLLGSLKDKNPINILEKGFAQIKSNGEVVNSVKNISVDDNVNIRMKDGEIMAKVVEVNGNRD